MAAPPNPKPAMSLVVAASCLAMLAIGDNSTAIMAALPAMARELGLGPAAVQWVVNAYLLASACFIVLGGESADRYGPRRSSLAGIAAFGLASLQGVGAAFAVAGTLAAVNAAAAPARRAAAISAWTGFLMLGFSIGPLVGGVLTHDLGWRANFWLNLLLMALSAAGFPPVEARQEKSPTPPQAWPDWVGLTLLGGFMIALIFALQRLSSLLAAPWDFAGPFALALAALAGLLRVERRRPRPLVDFGFFAQRRFGLAAALLFLSMCNIMTLLLYYNLFAQAATGLGYSAIRTGLSLLPLSIALIGFARAAPRLASAVGPRRVTAGGMLVTALGLLLIHAGMAGPAPLLSLGLFVTGAGIALPYASAPRLGLAALSDSQSGQGSGMLNSCSFLGGTVGVTCGGIAFGQAGFAGALSVIGASALLGAGLCAFFTERS